MLLDNFQDKNLRLYQSMMATRYTKPLRRQRYVMSVAQTWLGCGTSVFLSKYGYALCVLAGLPVFGVGATDRRPIKRSSRNTLAVY